MSSSWERWRGHGDPDPEGWWAALRTPNPGAVAASAALEAAMAPDALPGAAVSQQIGKVAAEVQM